jgi:lysozyme
MPVFLNKDLKYEAPIMISSANEGRVLRYAETILIQEEGFSAIPYYDTEGYPTIGYGQKLSNIKCYPLSDLRVTEEVAREQMKLVISSIYKTMDNNMHYKTEWRNLNNARKAVIVAMIYQMGYVGVMKFEKMWAAIKDKKFIGAYIEMRDSLWFKQTTNRATRMANIMYDGEIGEPYYATFSVKPDGSVTEL